MSRLRRAGPVLAVLLCSCVSLVRGPAPLSPEEAARGYADRLSAVSSFAFELRYHTEVPFRIAAELTGIRESSDREAWNGTWYRGTERSRVALRAAGPVQYEREGAVWRRTQRGIETRILEQLDPVIKDNRLTFVRTERGRHVYRFVPEVPILDPTQTLKLQGLIELSTRTGLPEYVYCSDSSRTAEWTLKLGRFGRAGRVSLPIVPAQTVTAAPTRRLSRAEYGSAERVLDARLGALDLEFDIDRVQARLRLVLARRLADRQLAMVLAEGRVEVRAGIAAVGPDTAGSVVVAGDAAHRVRLARTIAGPGTLNAQARLDVPVQPRLAVVFGKAAELPVPGTDSLLVLVLDGSALSSTRVWTGSRVEFGELGAEDIVATLAAVANSGLLPARFHVVEAR